MRDNEDWRLVKQSFLIYKHSLKIHKQNMYKIFFSFNWEIRNKKCQKIKKNKRNTDKEKQQMLDVERLLFNLVSSLC